MNQIGIFTKTFQRATLAETLDAVAVHGFKTMQFNMECAGVPSMPDAIDPTLAAHIREACAVRGMRIAALSGTLT